MTWWNLSAGLLGGVGLFLLGMRLMTEGLKLAAGPAMSGILARSTKTRLRALFSAWWSPRWCSPPVPSSSQP